jgi:ornithine cyclodeaminase/alanine dehydrogenase-like protein (mu-crystallin family)
MSSNLRTLSAAEVAALGPSAASAAIRRVLVEGLDPEGVTPRSVIDTAHGQSLLMPAEWGRWYGVKLVTIAPDNPARGLPRINGLYLLHDAETLVPQALLDGIALTNLRTAATSMAVVGDRLSALAALHTDGLRVVVFGRGPQAIAHVAAIRAAVPIADVTLIGRDDDRGPVRHADVVVCATTAREPLFDSALLKANAVVIAVGSHEPGARELDAKLLGLSTVVVESLDVATREAGDVVMAIAEGFLDRSDLVPMRDVVTGRFIPDPGVPLVFKGCGMGWQDLAVAAAAYEQWTASQGE